MKNKIPKKIRMLTFLFSRLQINAVKTSIGIFGPAFLILIMASQVEGYASHEQILAYYSPYIIQEVDCTIFGDFITSFDYDGDYIATNNWDNLGTNCGSSCGSTTDSCKAARTLPAYVYVSVIETDLHFYLCYAFFHPADDFHCHDYHHENDLEGMIVMVLKDGTTYGQLRMVQLQAHIDFYQHKAPGATGIEEDHESLDGLIEMYGTHPVVYVEGGGHGIRREPMGENYIHYNYTGTAQNATFSYVMSNHTPGVVPAVGYDFLMIASEFWQRKQDPSVFGDISNYLGYRFSILDLGIAFGANTCTNSGPARPPWAWDDWDDGDPVQPGDWFMDPARVNEYYFNWSEGNVNRDYIYHPFLYNDLGGETYGFLKLSTVPAWPYYSVKQDVYIPNDHAVFSKNILLVEPNVELRFDPGRMIVAQGQMDADGRSGTIRFISSSSLNRGTKVDGQLRVKNGGAIKLY